jgi:hypothetical protein
MPHAPIAAPLQAATPSGAEAAAYGQAHLFALLESEHGYVSGSTAVKDDVREQKVSAR